jgi:aminopeptidase-like protein
MSLNLTNLTCSLDEIKDEMYSLMENLFPICRSITGNGVRQTLEILQNLIPLSQYEIPTGTKVFDWIVPKEWNINDAYISDSSGKKVVDFKDSNLHILNYSIPQDTEMSFDELKKHLFSIPEQPDDIPYVTSYYNENWGFCLEHNRLLKMKNEMYKVVVDSKLENGFLTYGEFLIKGESKDEILISTYVCHPSMCNDNLSGIVVATALAKYLKNFNLKYSIRFLFIPETIGAITWISQNEEKMKNIKHGLVLTCIGDRGKFVYKKTRMGNAEIDNTVIKILQKSNSDFEIIDFYPWGSDERQFSSPGFNLPVGSLMRSIPNREITKEYHTSADNLDFMSKKSLLDSFEKYFLIIEELEKNFEEQKSNSNNSQKKLIHNQEDYYLNINPKCEPQLGKYQLYENFGGQYDTEKKYMKNAIFWVLNLSDGFHSLKEISKRSNLELKLVQTATKLLETKKLVMRKTNVNP